jgi:sulfotransferase
MKQFVALSGLPRTGSTLLSAILSQNPNIHAEGNSAVCQLMWDMQQSIERSEQLRANGKQLQNKMVKQIPNIYYDDVKKPIVVDKCRSWTLPANMQMLKNYFDNAPKIIVLVRPVREIVASFMSLRKLNGWQNLSEGLFDDGSEPLMRSLAGVEWAHNNNDGEYLFVSYDELVTDTKTALNRIYAHCGWQIFNHNFDNIVATHKENDAIYGLIGQHDIRPQINKRNLDIELSDELIKKCDLLDDWSNYAVLR